jgi:FkbM family methyltransferase
MFRRSGLYLRLKYSRLFRGYERLFKPEVGAAHQKEVRLYRGIVGNTGLIFDIGAYDGHKTAAFLEICEKVVACEPDPDNYRLLQVRFRRRRDRVILEEAAVSDRVGAARMLVHRPGSAFNTLNERWVKVLEADGRQRWNEDIRFAGGVAEGGGLEVRTTTLDELILRYGVPGFIKIDVEGFEKKVFDGLSRAVDCLSFECLLPEFRDDLLYILRRLKRLREGTVFNVVADEVLVLPEFVGYDRIVEWVETTPLFTFDMVARAAL